LSDRDHRIRRFEAATLVHLDAAYNLARWLLRNDQNAQDAVQEAYLRGLRFFDGFRGGDARPWLLGIVRNVCFSALKGEGGAGSFARFVEFDEAWDSSHEAANAIGDGPERALMQKQDRQRIDRAIDDLPPAFREVIVLRELEDLSYEDIAEVTALPIGTVMSRLSRARAMLRATLARVDV
jgi:RNA polymerase sigma factor (sigma-70 family)